MSLKKHSGAQCPHIKWRKEIHFYFFKIEIDQNKFYVMFLFVQSERSSSELGIEKICIIFLKMSSFLSQYCKQYGTKNKLSKMIQAIRFPLCFSWLFICFCVQILGNKSKLENLIMYINVFQKKLMMETLLIHFT